MTDEQMLGWYKDELWQTRRSLVELAAKALPEELGNALIRGYKTTNDRAGWHYDTIRKIVDTVEFTALDKNNPYERERAICPLCKEGPASERGYTANGLYNHIDGSGNVQHCRVMKAASALARSDY